MEGERVEGEGKDEGEGEGEGYEVRDAILLLWPSLAHIFT